MTTGEIVNLGIVFFMGLQRIPTNSVTSATGPSQFMTCKQTLNGIPEH